MQLLWGRKLTLGDYQRPAHQSTVSDAQIVMLPQAGSAPVAGCCLTLQQGSMLMSEASQSSWGPPCPLVTVAASSTPELPG